MKKLLLLCLLITLTSCTEIIDNAIENAFDDDNSNENYDTFVTLENNSDFQLDNFELYFDNSSTFYSNKINTRQVLSNTLKYHYISNAPRISFYINNVKYESSVNNNPSIIHDGNYRLIINILSTDNLTFYIDLSPE